MKLNQLDGLVAFKAVAQARSFTAAADGLDVSSQAVSQAVNEMSAPERLDRDELAERMRFAVRRFVNQRFQRKPVILPMILDA